MNMVLKSAATAALLGALAFAFVTPSEARYGRWAAGRSPAVAAGAALARRRLLSARLRIQDRVTTHTHPDGSAYTTPGTYYQSDDMSGCANAGQLRACPSIAAPATSK